MIEIVEAQRHFQVGEQIVHALNGLSLEVAAGEYVSIMGPSGSGKSTLLNVIGLLDRLSAGTYRLRGEDVTRLPDPVLAALRRQTIGFVFQFFHLIPRLSAAENIELPLTLAGIPAEERSRRVEQVLTAYGLTDRARHRPDQLSGGQRQRVAIARATVTQPQVLLADEPTGNLDRHAGREVMELLEHLHRGGLTLLLVTHDPELAARANRRIYLVDGKIERDERRRRV
ncbi:MAG: ABC transporter ATP-binding protein [Gammaproteobacteria bacterium]